MAKPEMVFKAGAVRAAIFVNTIQRDGHVIPIRKVTIEVRYRDKNGDWQGTNSLSLNEVPKAMTALQQSYEYMLAEGSSPIDAGENHAGSGRSQVASNTSAWSARSEPSPRPYVEARSREM